VFIRVHLRLKSALGLLERLGTPSPRGGAEKRRSGRKIETSFDTSDAIACDTIAKTETAGMTKLLAGGRRRAAGASAGTGAAAGMAMVALRTAAAGGANACGDTAASE